jgi:hypothetical protein
MLASKVILVNTSRVTKSVEQYQRENEHYGDYNLDEMCVLFKLEHISPVFKIDFK